MRLSTERIPDPLPLPQPYRLADFKESLLRSLVDTYFAAWSKDYYGEDDRADIADYFRQMQFDDLRLAQADNGNVVGYVAVSRTSKLGVIDEVAVHPAHRRKGLGESLVRTAIQSLRGPHNRSCRNGRKPGAPLVRATWLFCDQRESRTLH